MPKENPPREKSFLEKSLSTSINAGVSSLCGLACSTFNPFTLPRAISTLKDPEKRSRMSTINCLAFMKGYLAGLGGLGYLVYKDLTSENLRYWPIYASIAAANLVFFIYSCSRDDKQK